MERMKEDGGVRDGVTRRIFGLALLDSI
jgi:hypothetical protein